MTSEIASKKELPEDFDRDQLILKLYKLESDICKSRQNRNCNSNARCIKGLGQPIWLLNPGNEKIGEDDDCSEIENAFRGLKNLGATCYINAFLQLWFHNNKIRKAIYDWRSDIGETCDPITCLQIVFSMMQFSMRPCVDPSIFIKCLHLDESQEQDTHEFSSLFNGYIAQKLNYRDNSYIQDTINQQHCIKIVHNIHCLNCNYISERESESNELLLSVKGCKELEECISAHLKEELLEGSNRYACQVCKELQLARSYLQIRQLPPILNLQLLRFESANGVNRKINSFLKFPKILDMSKFINDSANTPRLYHLSSIIIHEGQTTNSGHYITFIKKKNNWFKFNDEKVEKLKDLNLKVDVDDEAAKKNGNESSEKCYKSKNAYILVYMLNSELDYELPNSYQECNLPDYLIDYIEQDNADYARTKNELIEKKIFERKLEREHKRNVKNIYENIEASFDQNNFDAINKLWLQEFFKCKDKFSVPKVKNETLLCIHNNLDMNSSFKCISTKSADLIYQLYGYDIRIRLPENFCKKCIDYYIEMNNVKKEIENDSKEITSLLKFKTMDNDQLFWVGRESFKKWRNIKLDTMTKEFNCDFSDNFIFNQDLLCEHGNLCIYDNKKRFIEKKVWDILRKYFPDSVEFTYESPECAECLEMDKTFQNIRNKNLEIANEQRTSLNDLYNGHSVLYWTDLKETDTYHIISTKFYEDFKKFLHSPNKCSSPPVSLSDYEHNILCNSHSLFLFPPFENDHVGYDKSYLIINDNDWKMLTSFYQYNIDVKLENLILTPDYCQNCFDFYSQQQQMKKFVFENSPIFIEKLNNDEVENGHCNDPDDANNKITLKRLKLNDNPNITKRSLRRKRSNVNELELIVSSNYKLKDVKFKIMQHFNIATYDQVLYYNNKPLLSQHNNDTLFELEIEPYSRIHLKVDYGTSENVNCDSFLMDYQTNLNSEAGFKGTKLQL